MGGGTELEEGSAQETAAHAWSKNPNAHHPFMLLPQEQGEGKVSVSSIILG